MKPMSASRRVLVGIALCILALATGGAMRIVQDTCGPFTDVTPGFCPYVLELYYLGITVGTSATTFSPDQPLTRGQAAVFVARGLNRALARSSRRAALGQWWTTTPQYDLGLGVTTVGSLPTNVVADGADIWATVGNSVVRGRASDGKLLETWTGVTNANAILVAMGRIFLTVNYPPTDLYMIDPSQPAGNVTPVAANLGLGSDGISFDGSRIWSTSVTGAVSIITPGSTLSWSVDRITTGFHIPLGIVFDGSSTWVGDQGPNTLNKLDSNGAIQQVVSLSGQPGHPVFDGANIWVPFQNSGVGGIDVVRALDGSILATLTGNGLTYPSRAAFDGERILVTNSTTDTVLLWRAADASFLGSITTGRFSSPFGVCSDGLNFWIALNGAYQLARF